MTFRDDELVACFQSVFPYLSADEVRALRKDQFPEWDSLAALTLITVLEEEYDVRLADDDVERLDSFAGARELLAQLHAQ